MFYDPEVAEIEAIEHLISTQVDSFVVYAQSLYYNVVNDNRKDLKGKVDLLVDNLRRLRTQSQTGRGNIAHLASF